MLAQHFQTKAGLGNQTAGLQFWFAEQDSQVTVPKGSPCSLMAQSPEMGPLVASVLE